MRRAAAWVHSVWRWAQDFCAIWLAPFFSLLTLISGTLLNFDWSAVAADHPQWAGPLELAGNVTSMPVFISSAALSLALGVVVATRGKSLRTMALEQKSQRSQIAEIGNVIVILFDGLLLNLATRLKLTQESQVRLSLYVHEPTMNAFIPCGRYSPNPHFRVRGRTSYPDHEGCIGKGWVNGWHFDSGVPTQPAARRAYNLKSYSIPEHVSDSVRMKSALYAAKRLDDATGAAVAVLVVEALGANHFVEGELRDTVEAVVADYARVVHAMRGYIPNPADAAASGL